MNLPLEGVRVLAISQFGAGPFATLNLADLGREVIKVEDPSTGGEVSQIRPALPGGRGQSLFSVLEPEQAEHYTQPPQARRRCGVPRPCCV